jgi:hypothetical protein
MKLVRVLFLSVLLIGCIVGCAAVKPEENRSEDGLMKRVEMIWQAKVGGNWELVYDMTVLSYRQKVEKSAFLARPKVVIQSFAVKGLEMIDPGNKAQVKVDYKLNHMGYEFDMTAEEIWVWEEGDWKNYRETGATVPGA